MNYSESQANLATLQAPLVSAKSAVVDAQAAVDALQPLVDAAQAALNAFHVYQIDLTPGGSDSYSNPQFPPDATTTGNANITQVIRDSQPDPITVDHSVYDTSALTWGDPTSESLAWSDMGTVPQ